MIPSSGNDVEKLDHSYTAGGKMVVILEDSLAVPHKLKYSLTLQPSNHTPLWAFILEKWKTCSHKNLYMNIHGSCVSDGQKLETSQMFFIVWIDRYAVVHPHNKILLIDLSQLEIGLSLNKPI